ncbi:hypothetical protein G647_06492 [Cladophialophora carrionii CBS 160.54]|uniref:Uncharacterized protein n=1 Tax=Cladophialophora carrionii CBS 160.54 TaxID=1279043 RepID=V9D8X7_9EURO|nr:uncharacterized protein G647_06492 [Cladophialophora carrionii CBS 160.54]ETI22417.1 hypothetical protein G647_06492 [Cladophialophora carrionii CBS 160.54]
MDDADETMTTSTSSTPSQLQDTTVADDEVFDREMQPAHPHLRPGDSNRAVTPANDHLNAAAPGELSPPRIQPTQAEYTAALLPDPAPTSAAMANGTAVRSSARLANANANTSTQPKSGGAGDTAAFPALAANEKDIANQPGGGWKNKKAQEDMHRAWDNIVDRDVSLKEYGDVMMQGKAQRAGV